MYCKTFRCKWWKKSCKAPQLHNNEWGRKVHGNVIVPGSLPGEAGNKACVDPQVNQWQFTEARCVVMPVQRFTSPCANESRAAGDILMYLPSWLQWLSMSKAQWAEVVSQQGVGFGWSQWKHTCDVLPVISPFSKGDSVVCKSLLNRIPLTCVSLSLLFQRHTGKNTMERCYGWGVVLITHLYTEILQYCHKEELLKCQIWLSTQNQIKPAENCSVL